MILTSSRLADWLDTIEVSIRLADPELGPHKNKTTMALEAQSSSYKEVTAGPITMLRDARIRTYSPTTTFTAKNAICRFMLT